MITRIYDGQPEVAGWFSNGRKQMASRATYVKNFLVDNKKFFWTTKRQNGCLMGQLQIFLTIEAFVSYCRLPSD